MMNVLRTVRNDSKGGERLKNNSILIVLILFIAVMQILQPKFLTPANICSVLFSTSSAGIVAVGAMFVLISGGLDFTSGYGTALCGVVGGVLYQATGNASLLLAGCVLCGILIGIVNGLIITKMKIQPFIATLAMMLAIQGFIYLVCEGQIIFLDDPVTEFIGKATVFGIIPVQAVFFIAVVLLGHFILNCTKLGTYTYAIGGNEEAARCAGIPIDRYKVYIFVFAGLCTGIASVMMVAQLSLVTPSIGTTTLMDAISAAVIGGTSTAGGKGTAFGTFIGALIIGMISNALVLLLVPTNAQYLVKGLIIIFALYFNRLVGARE